MPTNYKTLKVKTITTTVWAVIFCTATVLTQGDLDPLFAQDEFYIVPDVKREGGSFGISNVIVDRGGGKSWILIGDPDTVYNTSSKEQYEDGSQQEPVQGQVFRCDWTGENKINGSCIRLRPQEFEKIIDDGLRKDSYKTWIDTSAAKFGSTVVHGHNTTVICGPTVRFRVRQPTQKNKTATFLPGGCYTITDSVLGETDGNLSCSLTDQCVFIQPEQKTEFADSSSSKMLGFSAAMHPSKPKVILGAPEQLKVTGGAVEVSIPNPDTGTDKWQAPPQTSQYERAGWAVKVGHDSKRHFLAVSTVDNRRTKHGKEGNKTPLSSNSTGGPAAVYILDYDEKDSWDNVNKSNSEKWLRNGAYVLSNTNTTVEYGAFFGYSMETVDVDNKNGTEVLVGAPFNSSGSMFDLGCVVVIDVGWSPAATGELRWNVWNISYLHPDTSGEDVRFGSSISKVGDINKDGFQDVAIGAPMEGDSGAVYLFCGSANGLKGCGKLFPANRNLQGYQYKRGFGYSIFGGTDLDGNRTPDMAVGWVGTGAVAIYRSRHSIDIKLGYDKINLAENFTETTITLSFNFSLRLAYEEPAGEKALDFGIQLKGNNSKYFRLSYGDTKEVEGSLKFQLKNVNKGRSFNITITRTDVAARIDAVEANKFGLEYKVVYNAPQNCSSTTTVNGASTHLEANCSTSTFCPTCPFTKETKLDEVVVEFCRPCDDGGIGKLCRESLPACEYKATVRIESMNHTRKDEVLPLDNFNELHIRVSVKTVDTLNRPTFNVLVESSANLQYRMYTSKVPKSHILESSFQQNFTAVQVTGKEYLSKRGLTLELRIPLENMTASTNEMHRLNITVQLFRANRFQFGDFVPYSFLPNASVELSSDSKPYTHQIGMSTEGSGKLSLKFRVKYQGKSKTRSELRFLFPLCYLEEVKGKGSQFIGHPTIDNWGITCMMVEPAENDITFHQLRVTAETNTEYSCPPEAKRNEWLFYSCYFVNRKDNEAYTIEFPVNVSLADKFISTLPGSTAKVFGIGWIQVLNAADTKHQALARAVVEIKFSIESVPFWMILVAIGVGVLIFIILVGVLFKLGFFRRKVKEELESLKAGAAQSAEKEKNGEPGEMEGFETIELNQMD